MSTTALTDQPSIWTSPLGKTIWPSSWSSVGKCVYYLKEGSADDRELLGLKGANLCEMHRIGLPVPPAFTISSKCSLKYHEEKKLIKEFVEEIKFAVGRLEHKTGKKFGNVYGDQKPLLLSVRSSSAVAMPGMMTTVLNLGMNKNVVRALTEQSNDGRWALQTYMKFLQAFGTNVKNVPAERYEEVKKEVLNRKAAPLESLLSVQDLQDIVDQFKLMASIPGDPWEQLQQCIEAAFRAWYSPAAVKYRDLHSIPESKGAAVTVQAMVFGNTNLLSGAGQATTRSPETGEKKLCGSYLGNAEGDELLLRRRVPMTLSDLEREHPDVHMQLTGVASVLERNFKDAQEFEFTVENLQLFVLETSRAPRSDRAAVRIAVDMVREGLLTEREALLRINPSQLQSFAYPMLQDQYWSYEETHPPEQVFGRGQGGGGGAVVGELVFNADQAQECWRAGRSCILLRASSSRQDLDAIRACNGVITLQDGLASFAATAARSQGKAVVVDLPDVTVDWDRHTATCTRETEKVLRRGDNVTIDGATGWVYLEEKPITLANQDTNFETIMGWADKYRRLYVVATANSLIEVTAAKRLSAESVGLFRAQSFLLEEGRTDLFLNFVLAADDTERSQWLARLLPLLQQDFTSLYRQLGNCALSVVLPDAPLQDFLPSLSSPSFEDDLSALADRLHIPNEQCLNRLQQLHSSNPLLGLRGCRLCIVLPEITEVFTKAIVGAALELSRGAFPALPTIVLPFAFSDQEADRVASLVTTVSESMCAKVWVEASTAVQTLPTPIAVLLETPRACYKADFLGRLRNVRDLIINTDALTDLVFGMHEDCAGGFMPTYLTQHLVPHNPFEALDEGGVGNMVLSAIKRAHRPGCDVSIGVTGRHAGDVDSIAFFERVGVQFLCCAPQHVPTAKVAAAQAHILNEMRMSGNQPAYRFF